MTNYFCRWGNVVYEKVFSGFLSCYSPFVPSCCRWLSYVHLLEYCTAHPTGRFCYNIGWYCAIAVRSDRWLVAARGAVLLHVEGRDRFLTCILKFVRDTGRSQKHGLVLMSKHEKFFSGSEKCFSVSVRYVVARIITALSTALSTSLSTALSTAH
jgi:hypothetical protein